MSLERNQQSEDAIKSQIFNGTTSDDPSQQVHDVKETASKKLRDAAGFVAFWQRKRPDLTTDEILELAVAQGIELRNMPKEGFSAAGPSTSPVDPSYQREVSGLQSAFEERLKEEPGRFEADGLKPDTARYRDYSTTEYGVDEGDIKTAAEDDRSYEPKQRNEAEKAAADAVYGERVRRGRSASPDQLTKQERKTRSLITIKGQPRYLTHGLATIAKGASEKEAKKTYEGVFRPEMDPGYATQDALRRVEAALASGSLSPDQQIQAQALIKRLKVDAYPKEALKADRAEAGTIRQNDAESAEFRRQAMLLEASGVYGASATGQPVKYSLSPLNNARAAREAQFLEDLILANVDSTIGSTRSFDPSRMPLAGYNYNPAARLLFAIDQATGEAIVPPSSSLANAPTTSQQLNAPNNNPPKSLVDLMTENFDSTRQVSNISGELGLLSEKVGKGLFYKQGQPRVHTPIPSSGIRSYEEAEAVLNNLLSLGKARGVNFNSKGENEVRVTDPGINHLLRNNLHYSSTGVKNLVNALAQLSLAQSSGINQDFKDSYQGGGISTPYRSAAAMESVDLGASGPNVRFGMDALPTEKVGISGILEGLQRAGDSEQARFRQVDSSRIEGTEQEVQDAVRDTRMPYKGQMRGDTARNKKETKDPKGSILGAQKLKALLQQTTKPGKNQTQADVDSLVDRWVSESEGIRSRQAQTEADNPPSPVINNRGAVIYREGADLTVSDNVSGMGVPAPVDANSRPKRMRETDSSEAELDRLAGSSQRNDAATTRRRREAAVLKQIQRNDPFGEPTVPPRVEPRREEPDVIKRYGPPGQKQPNAQQGPVPSSARKQFRDRANFIRKSPRMQRGRQIGYATAGGTAAVAGVAGLINAENERRREEELNR